MAAYYEQGPPSPPFDDNSSMSKANTAPARCSLPSISNLLDLAGQGSPTHESAPNTHLGQMASQKHLQLLQQPTDFSNYITSSRTSTRPPSQSGMHSSLHGGALPPTPPMSTEASFSGYNSPSIKTSSRSSIGPDSCEATPPPQYGAPRMEQQLSSTSTQPSYYAPSFRQPQWQRYAPPPPPPSRSIPTAVPPYQPHPASMHPTPPPDSQPSNLYYQQPLPGVKSFTSMPQSPQQSSRQPSPQLLSQQHLPPFQHQQPRPHQQAQPSQWQHHHYISPAMAAAFPLAQDRYVCSTCSKAFSRPSSLRIHSHSHTGEKPFKCPHQGCGKAFSVRSNMKRHERGCHNYETAN